MNLGEHINKYLVATIVLLLFLTVIILIILFPNHKAHSTVLEYLKIVFSWPGVIIIVPFILIYVIRLAFFSTTRTEYVGNRKENITGFVNIVGKTEDGDLIIKNQENYEIKDGDVIVNEAFMLKFFDILVKAKSLEKELKRYQEHLLTK